MSKGISKLAGNANIASVKTALSNLDKCVGELADLADSCEGPAVMAISLVPNVGSVVGFVCSQASSMVAKFRSIQDRVNSGLSIVNSISTAAVEGRHVRLSFSIKGTMKNVAKGADKAVTAVAKTADKAATAVVKTAQAVGKVLASLANPIDMALNQVFVYRIYFPSITLILITCNLGWIAHTHRAYQVCRVLSTSRKRLEETCRKTQQGNCNQCGQQLEILHEET